ncbi:hypothetical protein Ancab_034076 [Ancistrocladus abbreviatus]
MEAENILKLFDSKWFELDFFKKQPTSSPSEPNPDHKSQENPTKSSEFSSLSSIASTSISEEGHLASSKTSEILESLSPNSVLFAPKLQTIHSGKESKKLEAQETPTAKISSGRRRERRMDRKKGLSRSLSELEFQELKGFMDLGFVFSEEDKDSTLASIIPGLQRLGKKEEDEDGGKEREDDDDGSEISRPYLSEAWENLEKGKREKLLMNWRVPASTTSVIDMKEFLRCWAHYVASSVVR